MKWKCFCNEFLCNNRFCSMTCGQLQQQICGTGTSFVNELHSEYFFSLVPVQLNICEKQHSVTSIKMQIHNWQLSFFYTKAWCSKQPSYCPNAYCFHRTDSWKQWVDWTLYQQYLHSACIVWGISGPTKYLGLIFLDEALCQERVPWSILNET